MASVLVPYSELTCLICCMIPDILCVEVVVCGSTYTARLRRVPPGDGVAQYQWDTCAGFNRVQMVCDPATGSLQVVVADGGSGGPLPVKVPDVWCGGFHVEWTYPADDMPVWRCGSDDNQPIARVTITDTGRQSCPACTDGGGGLEQKTIRFHAEPCATVCSCCALVPCKQCLNLTINAPHCDWDGITFALESPDHDSCVWTGSVDPASQPPPTPSYPNCGPLTATATCTDGGFLIAWGSVDLADCAGAVRQSQRCRPTFRAVFDDHCTGAA